MSATGVPDSATRGTRRINLAPREDAALAELKQLTGCPASFTDPFPSSTLPHHAKGSTIATAETGLQIDTFLLRFLRSKRFNVEETIDKLRRRREFEKCLPSLQVSLHTVRILRSGAFSVIGSDVLRRPILFVRLEAYRPPSSDFSTTGAAPTAAAAVSGSPSGMSGFPLGHAQPTLQPHALSSSANTTTTTSLGHSAAWTEAEKLFIILFEYLQSFSIQQHTEQECVLLVSLHHEQRFSDLFFGPGGSGPSTSNTIRDSLITILTKYYPDLIGLVLVVDAPWIVKRGVRHTMSSSGASTRAMNIVQLVDRKDLTHYLDPLVIPVELGGRNRSIAPPWDFADSVLRHWYSVTTMINFENISTSSTPSVPNRPLWQLPHCPLISAPSFIALERESLATRTGHGPGHGSSGGMRPWVTPVVSGGGIASMPQNPRRGPGSSKSGGVSHRRSSIADVVSMTDDGVCSMISDGGEGGSSADPDEDEERPQQHHAAAAASKKQTKDNNSSTTTGANNGSVSARELEKERFRRIQLEQEVARLRLGISLDESTLTPLEKRLRQIHEELNILVGEVIHQQTVAAQQRKRAADAKRRNTVMMPNSPTNAELGSIAPSLLSLVEATDVALLMAIQEKQPVPAVNNFSAPVRSRAPSKTCPCM